MIEIFLSPWGLISLTVAVGLFVAWHLFCRRKLSAVNDEVERVLAAVAVDEALKESALLKPAWNAFEKTLTRTDDAVYSTTDAAEFFSMQSLTQGLNMTFWQNYGGIFTGLGILGTFVGLTVGLSGVDVTSGDIDTLKGSIANLLAGVGTAFLTSLVGIGAAIVYNIAHHGLLATLGENIRGLTDKLDEIFPRRSVEDWLSEKFSETRRQTRALQSLDLESQNQTVTLQSIDAESKSQTVALKNIGEDVATAIYDGLDARMNDAVDKFCTGLEEKILPQVDRICAAIEQLGSGGGDKLGEIISGRIGNQMDRFSAALENFTDKTENILANAQEVSTVINGQLLATLKELTDTLNGVAEKFKAQQDDAAKDFEKLLQNSLDNFIEIMAKILEDAKKKSEDIDSKRKDADENFLATLSRLTDTLNEVVKNFKAQQDTAAVNCAALLKKSLDNFNAGMAQVMANSQVAADETNKQNREASENFLATLSGLTKTLNAVAEKFKAQQDDAAKGFEKLLQNSLDNFIEIMAGILEDAKKKSEDIDKNFLATLSRLTDTLNEVVKNFKAQQDTAAVNFAAALHSLIDELKAFTEQQKEFLDDNAFDNAAQINTAVNAFREIVNRHNETMQKTFDQIQKLLAETESLLEIVDKASLSFKQAADPVKQSTLQLTQNLTATSAQMKTLADANQTTRENLAALSTQLAAFVKNFNGIADQLERATKTIVDSLDSYNNKTSQELSDALTKFDKTVTGAYSGLDEIVNDLTEALDDFRKRR